MDVTANANTIQRTTQRNEGIIFQNASDGDMVTHITNNTITGIAGTTIFVGQVAGNATTASSLSTVIQGNNVTHSTSPLNRPLIVFLSSTVGQVAPANILVNNNTVTANCDSEVIFVSTPDANTDPSFTATVTNNNVTCRNGGPSGTALRGIAAQSTQDTSAGCFDIRSNTVTYTGGTPTGINGLRLRVVGPATGQLEQGVSSGTPAAVLTANNPGTGAEALTASGGTITVVSNSTCQNAPSLARLEEENLNQTALKFDNFLDFQDTSHQSPSEMVATLEPLFKHSADAETVSGEETINAKAMVKASGSVSASETIQTPETSYLSSVSAFVSDASNALSQLADKLGAAISPTVIAQEIQLKSGKKQTRGDLQAAAPQAGETICVDGNANAVTCTGGCTLPAGKTITITFNATISNNPPLPSPALTSVSNQGSVSGTGFATVLTDDSDVVGANQATVTAIDSTTVAVSSSVNPSLFGQSVTLTATLTGSPAHASGNPGGTVQFKDNGTNLGSPVAVVAGATNVGTAQTSVSSLTVGSHVITAEYSGRGGGFNANIGTLAGNQVVNKANTTTGLTSSQNPSAAAQTVTFTATIAAFAPGRGTPSGTVQFLDGGNPIAACASVALVSAQAQCAINTLSIGNHTVTAQYGEDGSFNTSNVGLTGNPQVVNKAATIYVDDTFAGSSDAQDLGGGKLFNRNAFATINNGLANVATGGTVNVEDGSYTENVTLNQSATVVGSGNIGLIGSLTITTGVWTSTGGVFSTTGNFTRNGGTFNHNNGTFVLSGSAAQTIGGSASTAFNNLTVSNAAGASLGIDETIGGALTLTNGILLTGTTTLTLTTMATSVRDGGCAITTCFVTSSTGGLKKQFTGAATASFIFPVGTTGGTDNGYSPVTLANATPTGTGDLTVRAVDAVSPAAIATPKITRYWALT